jgi:maltooligosyltrehalose trehalohydrolase
MVVPEHTPARSAVGFPALGALWNGSQTTFRVWAPHARSVDLHLGDDVSALTRRDDGLYESVAEVGPGRHYTFALDGGAPLPDPCSRYQPHGLRGPSEVVDLTRPGTPLGLAIEELVIYELHVGTFSPEGTFAGVIPRLAALRELGVTAIEVMPIATFAGQRGWGYDGVYLWAPHPAYGGPDGFRALVDAAHDAGLGVILDVVYNHMGAGSDAVTAFGPYLTDHARTFWGEAIDYSQRAVREWAIQNAEMWVRDYGVDGLRLDAVHAITDESPTHVLAELAQRVKAIHPETLVIDEMEIGDLRPLRDWGHDLEWEDALHHAIHVLLTGEREGYYAQYGSMADLARELQRPEGRRFVVCDQNHDQVGNRALGDRLRGRDLRLAAFCSLLSPGTPMLFQGEEYDEAHPFQYFTDHIDPTIAELTRQGRRREFSEFSDFAAQDIPDPQDPETFERSKLDPAAGDPAHLAYYRELLALRRELGDAPVTELHVDEGRRLLRFRRGPVALVANFADVEQDGVPARTGQVRR